MAMFDEYVASQEWITAADKPLVTHCRKICQQLDRMIAGGGTTHAAKDSSYLQAVERLNKRKPAPEAPRSRDPRDPLEGQLSIFDELD